VQLSLIVGFDFVLQHTPFAVIIEPPSFRTDPSYFTIVCEMLSTLTVITEGKDVLSFFVQLLKNEINIKIVIN
jgi:hypothetical protein